MLLSFAQLLLFVSPILVFLTVSPVFSQMLLSEAVIGHPKALNVERALVDSARIPSIVDDIRPGLFDAITNIPGDWVTAGDLATKRSSIPTLAGAVISTGALILVDRQTYTATHTFTAHNPPMKNASWSLVHLGDGMTHVELAAAFGLYGFIGSDSRALRVASQTIEALLATGVTVQVLKRVCGRESPEMASQVGGIWRPFPSLKKYQKNQPRYYSFPSGHIATTAATLTVLAENYPEQSWIRPVSYVVLAGVGVGLVNVRYHWYSDLPLGLLIGHAFGQIVSHNQDASRAQAGEEEKGSAFSIQPSFSYQGGGISVAYSF